MGYDTTLVIGREMLPNSDPGLVSAIVTVDLAVVGADSQTGRLLERIRTEGDDIAWRFYSMADGDTVIEEDRYGDTLTSVPMSQLLEAMTYDNIHDYEYRRFTLAIAIIKEFMGSGWGSDVEKIVCLQFGH